VFERILVPLDGSELAESALPYAEFLAKQVGSRVFLLSVAPSLEHLIALMSAGSSPTMPDTLPPTSVDIATQEYERERQDLSTYLETIQRRLTADGISVETEVREGDTTDNILDYANVIDASLIVMSTHGRGGLRRVVFGSVADALLRRAPHIPMLLHRHQPTEGD
jgi:nucleotide-binding universal stress UspA family protein